LPYGITQCYLLPDTNERIQPNPSQPGWYSINLPRRDERLSLVGYGPRRFTCQHADSRPSK